MDMCVFVDGQNTTRISTTEEAIINDDEDNMTLQQMPDSCAMEDNIDDGAELSIIAAPTSGNSIEKVPVTVEVCIRKGSTAQSHEVRTAVERLLGKRIGSLTYVDGPVPLTEGEDEFVDKHVERVSFTDIDDRQQVLLFWQVRLQIHAYQLHEEGAEEEMDEDEELAVFHEWQLPSRDFAGLWESLVFDSSIKHRLLRYSSSALLFAEYNVDPTLVAWNRVVLLFGPPGTGKTSLCKALAQKLAIIFQDRYKRSQLVEVNAHSLFSKWFSESGKLVSKLFTKIHELLDEEDSLLFILIDEVESLTAARQAALQGSEPSDSIRVVNALLTQIDALRARPNVMILTTSNITQAIDLAFVDRADIKAYIGPPSLAARYEILRSSVQELQRAKIIIPDSSTLVPYKQVDALQGLEPMSYQLLVAARGCENFSGRALRKLPFLAHASLRGGGGCCTLSKFLQALGVAVTTEREDRECMAAQENQARCSK